MIRHRSADDWLVAALWVCVYALFALFALVAITVAIVVVFHQWWLLIVTIECVAFGIWFRRTLLEPF